jgi:hypothetical protein
MSWIRLPASTPPRKQERSNWGISTHVKHIVFDQWGPFAVHRRCCWRIWSSLIAVWSTSRARSVISAGLPSLEQDGLSNDWKKMLLLKDLRNSILRSRWRLTIGWCLHLVGEPTNSCCSEALTVSQHSRTYLCHIEDPLMLDFLYASSPSQFILLYSALRLLNRSMNLNIELVLPILRSNTRLLSLYYQ